MKHNENKREPDSFKKWKRRRRITAALVTVFAAFALILCSVGVGFSWFANMNTAAERDMKVTNFSAAPSISIDGGATFNKFSNTTFISKADFSNMKLNINYIGESSAYIRVRIFESFKNSETDEKGNTVYTNIFTPVGYEPQYTLAAGWEYDAGGDYFYYSDMVKGGSEDAPVAVPFITGGVLDNGSINFDDSNGVNLFITIEEVQPDRYDEFFGAKG